MPFLQTTRPRTYRRLSGLAAGLLILTPIAVARAEEPAVLKEEAIRRLVERAWEDPPESLDATVIHTRRRRPETEQQVRQRLSRLESDIPEQVPEEVRRRMGERFEESVQKSLQRSREPVRMKRRVRLLGSLQRIDQTTFWFDSPFDLDAPYAETLVNGRALEGGTHDNWSINHTQQVVARDLRIGRPLYKKSELPYLGTIGESSIWLLRGATADRTLLRQQLPRVNQARVDALATGTHSELDILVRDAQADGHDALKFDIWSRESSRSPISSIITSTAVDRVYEVVLHDPETGRRTAVTTYSDWDEDGIPRRMHQSIIHDDGFEETSDFEVLEFAANVPIDDTVFEYAVPAGYEEMLYQPDGTVMTSAPGQKEFTPLARPGFPLTRLIQIANILFGLLLVVLNIRHHRRKRMQKSEQIDGEEQP